jgi:hypothetical protein
MTINKETTLEELLAEHPYLADHLVSISPALFRFKSPYYRRAVATQATVGRMASQTGMGVDEFISVLEAKIAELSEGE